MKQTAALSTAMLAAALISGATPVQAQAKAGAKPKTKTTTASRKSRRPAKHVTGSASERQIRELREMMVAQQVQLDGLKAQLATRDQQVATARDAAAAAQTQAAAASAASQTVATQTAQTTSDLQAVKSSVADLQLQNTTLTETVVSNQARVEDQINSPTTIHYKGVTIQPVAFFAFEGVWRQRALNSDINTPFNTIPFPSANEGHISELNFTGRQSRLGGLFTGDAGKYKLSGYFEADFLSAGVTSNNNQSNSYTLRVRQIWGQAALPSGFAVTGGQQWSLVTEDARGTDNRTEVLPNTVDSQYMVGFSWERQPGVRFQKRFANTRTGTTTLAVALEEAQITNFTATSATSGAVPTNFYFAGAGANGGLYNAFNGTYANNVAPDMIAKAAFDFAKTHLEVGGLARFLRDEYYPITGTTSTTTAGVTTNAYTYAAASVKSTATAGGAFGAIRVTPNKLFEVGVSAMGGTGLGRYGSGQLADATVRPDGELEPIKNYHGLGSLVTHPAKKLDLYAYYGGEYDQRTVYTATTGAFNGAVIGYGARNLNNSGCYNLPANPASSTGGTDTSPATCAAPTRYLQEGMFGLTYRLANSPKYGRLQYQLTYSLLQRNLWSGAPGTSGFPSGPRAQDNMIHTGMRYYIP